MKKNPEIYAYVLMRNDLASLGAGKAVAHGAHAANRMVWHIRKHGNKMQKSTLSEWENECDGVGTTIVLECDEETMKWCVSKINELKTHGCAAGVWHDPTYPSTTARGFCLMPVDVCGWAIGDKDLLKPILGDLPLMNNSEWKRVESE